jgi:DNA-directed RNA polymerase specialized sigma24 family protein
MKNDAIETRAQGFDELLTSPRFETMRGRIVRIFARRGCSIPEDLADETISRVIAKLPDIRSSYEGDPVHFVYAVARNVYREYVRRPRTVSIEGSFALSEMHDPDAPFKEASHDCLDRCLASLDQEDERLIREYYRYDPGAKIDRRKELAAELGLGMNALRIKACRIRQRLQGCVARCLKQGARAEMEDR